MPLRKFRSVEEMEAGPWLPAGDPRLARALPTAPCLPRRHR